MAKNVDDLELNKLNKFPELENYADMLDNCEAKEKPFYFKKYSLILLEAQEKGLINHQTAAYCIGSRMYISELKDHEEIDSLMWEAKELELSYDVSYGSKIDYIYEWDGFVKRLKSLKVDLIK